MIKDGNLTVGDNGHASLTISNGGRVSDADAVVALGTGSSGDVLVTSRGKWEHSEGLRVGFQGQGSLTVSEAGQVTAETGSVAVVTVATGGVMVASGGRLEFQHDLTIGESGDGWMTIDAGGRVTSANASMGRNAGSLGQVNVTQSAAGPGPVWEAGTSLEIGVEGKAGLTVQAGQVHVAGFTSIAAAAGSLSALYVRNARFSTDGDLNIGLAGNALVEMFHGAALDSGATRLGLYAGGFGRLSVVGTNAQWNLTGGLVAGTAGSGILTLNGASRLLQDGGYFTLAAEPGSAGHVELRDGFVLSSNATLFMERGDAQMIVAAGSSAEFAAAQLGSTAYQTHAATATLGVLDADSSFTAGYLTSGGHGTSLTQATHGGVVNVGRASFGAYGPATPDPDVRHTAVCQWRVIALLL